MPGPSDGLLGLQQRRRKYAVFPFFLPSQQREVDPPDIDRANLMPCVASAVRIGLRQCSAKASLRRVGMALQDQDAS
jgi:hypothetical protein